MTLLIGFMNRWHVSKDGEVFTLAIPGTERVHILPNKYQDVIPFDNFRLSYEEYARWLKDNNYEEVHP